MMLWTRHAMVIYGFRQSALLLLILLVCSSPGWAQEQEKDKSPAPTSAPFTINPNSGVPGKTYKITVRSTAADCQTKETLKKAVVTASGSGIEITATDDGQNCFWAGQLVIDGAADFGQFDVEIKPAEGKGNADLVTFSVVSKPPLPAGPIPPGLTPQVDVMWDIMSEGSCGDQFGDRLARHYFCIEVQLGNNSGYSLLLAGVGFLRSASALTYRESTTSYLAARSVVQREQVISGRNIALRSMQAAGLLIGGFIPLAGNAGRRGRIGIWSTLVGTTLATAWDGVVPDRTVRQASNLDDAAFRENKLIPNNSPAKFTVFVDRDALKPLLLREPEQLQADADVFDARAADLRAQITNAKGSDQTNTLSTAADLAEKEAKSLRRLATEITEKKHGKEPTKTQKSHLNRLARHEAPLEKDLVEVRRVLGTLIIVGDQIEFKQRIKIDSAPENEQKQQSAGKTTIDTITTSPAQPIDGQSFDFTIAGANFDPDTVVVTFKGPGCTSVCTGTLKDKNATQLKGSVTLSAGKFDVTAQNGSSGTPSAAKSVTVIGAAGTPSISTITTSPSSPMAGQSFDFTIAGTNFDPNTVVVTFKGTDCTSGCAGTLTDKTTTQVKGSAKLAAGKFDVTLQNGPSGMPSASKSITVAAGKPTPKLSISKITTSPSPPIGDQSFSFTITGTSFDSNTALVIFKGTGCASGCAGTVTDRTTTEIKGSAKLAVGKFNVTVQNGPSGSPSDSKSITVAAGKPAAKPSISKITTSPSSPIADQSFSFIITGASFDSNTVLVTFKGTGCTSGCAGTVTDRTTTEIKGSAKLAAGKFDVTVQNGPSGTPAGSKSFTVLVAGTPVPKPVITKFATSPAAPIGDQSFNFTITGTSFDPNTVLVTFKGPGCTPACVATLTGRTAIQINGSVKLVTGKFDVTVQNGHGGKTSDPKSVKVGP